MLVVLTLQVTVVRTCVRATAVGSSSKFAFHSHLLRATLRNEALEFGSLTLLPNLQTYALVVDTF